MEQRAFDDFDLITAEEYYSSSRFQTVKCDHCKERVLSSQIHTMQSFQYPQTDILICNRCYSKMHLLESKPPGPFF